ncbi:hypothetical protein PM082_000462 [Marasmius tenuissimus]|nr:hypothetical protein PM082_000462 [Marasmius tenuissimus]
MAGRGKGNVYHELVSEYLSPCATHRSFLSMRPWTMELGKVLGRFLADSTHDRTTRKTIR